MFIRLSIISVIVFLLAACNLQPSQPYQATLEPEANGWQQLGSSAGISYVAGETRGALRFKVGGQDVFLRKYDASGALQWTRQFGTTSNDFARDVTLDGSGNAYVLSIDSGTSFRIRKFNPSGKLLQTITNTVGVFLLPPL